MAKGLWQRVKTLWHLSEAAVLEDTAEQQRFWFTQTPKAEFLPTTRVVDIFTDKPNANVDDVLI